MADMQITLLAVLFVLSAFFSSAETVFFSLTGAQRARIRARRPAADRRIARCLADKAVLFSTLLVGNTFINFAIATLGYRLFFDRSPAHAWLAVPVMTVALLLFGEITPKRFALHHAESLAPAFARLTWAWRSVLSPFNFLLRLSARAFAPALERERRALSDTELVSVIEAAADDGTVTVRDAEMVEGVLRLARLSASDEMTPRVDIEGCDLDLPEADRARQIAASRHHYLPVYRRTHDAIEGVMSRASGRIEAPLFVPEQVALDDLLVTFAKSRKPLAVVLDEYGGTAGIITPNDILELIVGPDVFGDGAQEPRIERKGKDVWEIDARASLDEINRELETDLAAEDADRLSGWIQFHAERLPHVGQEIVADRCRATVLKRRRRRVTLVRLEVLSRAQAPSDEKLLDETDEAARQKEEEQ